jgi:hypothetical protein
VLTFYYKVKIGRNIGTFLIVRAHLPNQAFFNQTNLSPSQSRLAVSLMSITYLQGGGAQKVGTVVPGEG